MMKTRMEKQPLGKPGAGCFFKNPPSGKPAGYLIEATFDDGENNRIQFRGLDVAGNGPAMSEEHYLTVDTTGPEFGELAAGMDDYGEVEGVAVTAVNPGSPAARVGLRPGDVIIAVNRKRVTSVDDFFETLQDADRVVALNLYRNGAHLFIVVR